jgi:MFS family permease
VKLIEYAREGDWAAVAGAGLFVALAAGGYYYNITFVQLGLVDLGTEVVGLDGGTVSTWMAAFALLTVAVAVATGWTMDRRGWSRSVRTKLRLVTATVAAQFLLVVAAPLVRTGVGFGALVVWCSLSLGVAVPATFALAVDLVPVPDRGAVGGAATAGAFGVGAVYPLEWDVVAFSRVMAVAILPALAVLGALALRENPLVDRWDRQRERFGVGRVRRSTDITVRTLTFWTLVVLMFGVFFVDSLGFLRIVETPSLVGGSWQSPDLGVRAFIAGSHVAGAVAGAVLYRNFGRSWLFLWVFGTFAVTHLLYTFAVRFGRGGSPLAMPLFYALAVSLYTTFNFALWADLSTPDDVGLHTAVGVGVAGWTATFLSTSLALSFEARGVTLLAHLELTNALAVVLTLLVGTLLYVRWALAGRDDRPEVGT